MQFSQSQLDFALDALERSLEESEIGPLLKIYARMQLRRPRARLRAVQAAAEELHSHNLLPTDGAQNIFTAEQWKIIISILVELWPFIVRFF